MRGCRQGTSVCRFKSVPTCGPISACAARKSPAKIFVLLSSSLAMLSSEIYLRLKPYLVVEISSDIVTEHCCQVCVLSMMFCRSYCRLCADMVSDCAIWKLLGEPCGPPGQRGIWKYSSHLIFTFYPYRDKSVLELFHVVVFQWKTFSVLTQAIKTFSKIVGLPDYG